MKEFQIKMNENCDKVKQCELDTVNNQKRVNELAYHF